MNGRGKSTLLQSLLLFAQSMAKNNTIARLLLSGSLVNIGTFNDVVNIYSRKQKFGLKIQDGKELLSSTYGRDDDNPTMAALTDLKVNDQSYFSENSIDTFNKNSIDNLDKNSIDVSKSDMGSNSLSMDEAESQRGLGVIDKSNIKMLTTFEHIKYVSADRIGPREYMDRKPIDNNYLGVKGENLFQVIETHDSNFVEEVREALDEVLGGASVRIETSEQKSIIRLYLDSVNGSAGFKPMNVGFGYSYVLPVITALLLAENDDVLIVENPEAHLHPAAQARMASLIVKVAHEKNLQIFLETHSDHVINGLRIAVKNGQMDCHDVNVLHFHRETESTKTPVFEQIKMDVQGNMSNYPDEFMDEWTKQLLQLV